jgi:hypothetical protein
MGRKFIPHDIELLKEKLMSAFPEDPDRYGWFDPYELPDQISDDISKVEFDFENYEIENDPGYGAYKGLTGWQVHPNGLPFLGVQAGGDWEYPVFFIVYWDGKKLRGYIPKDGNIWNTDTKKAYGNDDTSWGVDDAAEPRDGINLKKRFPDIFDEHEAKELTAEDCPDGDPEKILADIGNRIHPR